MICFLFASGVSTYVHMDLTPRLSAASGTNLIFLREHPNMLGISTILVVAMK